MSKELRLNLDESERARFSDSAAAWWDPEGPMRPLHDLNPARFNYVRENADLNGQDVLDIGCGGGILSESLASAGGRTTGIDISEQVLKTADLHLLESGLEVRYLQTTSEELAETEAGMYDVITCMEMLEHVPDPVSVVKSVARLLRPGGHAFFSTLSRTPMAFILGIVGAEHVAGICPKGTHRYDRFIKPSELSSWVRTSGMRTMDIKGIHYDPFGRIVKVGGHVKLNYLLLARKPIEAGAPQIGSS